MTKMKPLVILLLGALAAVLPADASAAGAKDKEKLDKKSISIDSGMREDAEMPSTNSKTGKRGSGVNGATAGMDKEVQRVKNARSKPVTKHNVNNVQSKGKP